LYYLLTSSYIAIIGIVLSIIMRLELSSPSTAIIASSNVSFYNYALTNHGLLMLLFIVMPIVFGAFGNYLLVLTLGLIDIVFPRINNLGWMILLLSWLIVQYSTLTEYLTGSGWTLYPPLSTITSTYVISSMYLALTLSGVSSLLTSINYLLLLPYTLALTDLLLVSFTMTSLMVLYTIPVLAGAFLLATSDILLTTSYFSNYSDPVLYQHLFWFFGHPEVYILILPSFGLINYQLSSLTSNYVFGTISMILALISILLFGSIVWSHHMFTVNLETDTNLYFTILTLIIAIPTGTKLYNWLYVTASSTSTPALPSASAQSTGTSTHLLLSYVFLLLVIQGGVTGVVLGNNVLDLQLHDTYYVVSHFHFILSVATVVSIVLTVSTLSTSINAYRLAPVLASALSVYSISTAFIMLNTIFLPMYYLGFNTMPRRIAEYSDYLSSWNSVSSISVITFYTATLLALLA
jgi:cytochrome c oxidase subunit 1